MQSTGQHEQYVPKRKCVFQQGVYLCVEHVCTGKVLEGHLRNC